MNALHDTCLDAPVPTGAVASDLLPLLQRSGLKPLVLGGRTLLPIFQGGMGVGVSGSRLAGTVASLGGVGTLSSVDLRRMARPRRPASRSATGSASSPATKAASTW